MDRSSDTPEQHNTDPLKPVFDRAMRLLLLKGDIDAEYTLPGNREQFPRYNAMRREVHSFTLTHPLEPREVGEASLLELYCIDDYIDETGNGNGGDIMIATLHYGSEFARIMTFQLEEDDRLQTFSWLEVKTPNDNSLSQTLAPELKQVAFQAICENDTETLTALVRWDENVARYIEAILMVLDINGHSEVEIDEVEELNNALTYVETVL